MMQSNRSCAPPGSPKPHRNGVRSDAATGAPCRSPAASRFALAFGLAVVAAALVSCAEPVALVASRPPPPVLTVSVHRSELLREYANPPLWVWTVAAAPGVAAVQASLDGGPYLPLHPSVRSFRPSRPLAQGSHNLTVRVTTAGAFASTLEASAEAQVAPLPGAPPVPDDPCYPAGGDPVRCGGAGANVGQWPLRQIRLPELWQALAEGVLHEPEPVVVAVLDTGYVRHPDLEGNLDTAAGYDFVSSARAAGDGDGIDRDATDPGPGGSWHGTAIAGLIAARTGNGMGVAGIGWPWGGSRITIMPVRVAGPNGATTYDVAQGLRYAAGLDNDTRGIPRTPARIINLSLAEAVPGPPDEVLEQALHDVTAAGAVVVAAAGNHGSAVRYPANSAYTLAVGAVALDRTLAATSNFGPQIDIVAPGGDESSEIPTLGAGPGAGASRWIVRPDHGTSIAAAHVSGVLALLAGFDRSLTLDDARALLADAALDLGAPGTDDRFGPGLLDAFALVGAYPAHTSTRGDRLVGERAGAVRVAAASRAGAGSAGPGSADPHTLIVRYRDREMSSAAGATASESLRARRAVAGVEDGAGGYALVHLGAGQDREQVKALLEADPAVAAVYDNRIYLPASDSAQ